MPTNQLAQTDFIQSIWVAACADAGIAVGSVYLYAFPGVSAPDKFAGKTWPANEFVRDGDLLDPAYEGHLNETWIRSSDRVAVWTDRTDAGIAGVLRHELEHVRQVRHDRSLWELYWHALALVGSVDAYQLIPMEADANAAGSLFARKRHGDLYVDELTGTVDHDRAVLRGSGGLPPLEGLHQRMVDFLASSGVSPQP